MRLTLFRFIILFISLAFSTICLADSQVTFTWDPVSDSDLAGYRLYQTAVSGQYTYGDGNQAETIPAGTETVTIHNVPDGEYYWTVTAYDEDGNESGPSNEVSARLDTAAPAAPTALTITEWSLEAQ